MTEYTMAEQNFRDEVERLAKREEMFRGHARATQYVLKISPRLDQSLKANVPAYNWGGAARTLLAETAENIIDVGLNGTAANAFEFREAIEHDGLWCLGSDPDVEQGKELAGLMFQHDWAQSGTIDGLVTSFTSELVGEVAQAIYRVTEEIWDECEGAEELEDTI